MVVYGAWRTELLKLPVYCVAYVYLGRRSTPHNECPLWRRPQRLEMLRMYLYWKSNNGHCSYVSLERSYNTVYIHALHKGLSAEKNNGKNNENMISMCGTHIEVGWLESCLFSTCRWTPKFMCCHYKVQKINVLWYDRSYPTAHLTSESDQCRIHFVFEVKIEFN
jgi:hypothetical protein